MSYSDMVWINEEKINFWKNRYNFFLNIMNLFNSNLFIKINVDEFWFIFFRIDEYKFVMIFIGIRRFVNNMVIV